jgi:biotin carboxyl carrier protein
MKMENDIYASKSGFIKRITVSEILNVNYGDILVEIGQLSM